METNPQIQSDRGAVVTGDINTNKGDFIGRDKITVGDINNSIVAIGHGATITIQEAPKLRTPLERPARAEHFQDRKEELAQLLTDLQPGKVVTLCGPGGMGKSALAAEAVWSLASGNEPPERFPDGILFHTFYGRNQAALALEHIARSFGEESRPTPKEAAQRALSGRRVLLLLDGTEEVDDLRPLLDIRNQCGVLITSRSRKDAVAGRQDLAPLLPEDAVALLQAWGGQRADNRAEAQGISQLVGRLPLALRLVGRYLATHDEEASDYRNWLEATPLVALDLGKRQEESVPLLLQRSLERVSEVARQVMGMVGLLALAPFEGVVIGAGLGLAEQARRQALDELVNYGLLLRRGEQYEVSHALIHTYARERLRQGFHGPVEWGEVVGRLGGYFRREFEEHAEEFGYLNRLRPHGMALLQVAGEGEAWGVVDDLAWAIHSYLDLQGYWAERVTAIEAGLAAARGRQNRSDEGTWLGKLGNAYWSLGQVERAIGFHEQVLVIAKEIGDHRSEGNALGNLGLAYADLGQVERAIGFHEQALVIAKEIGDRRSEGNHLGNLGLAYRNLGQVERAIGFYEQALVIAKEIGDRRVDGGLLGNLGLAYRNLGQVERAIGFYEQALVIAKEIGDRRGEGNALGNLGGAYWSLGQVERAIGFYEQALVIAKEIGDRRGEGNHLGNLGLAYADLGQAERAIGFYEQALVIAKEIGDRRGEGNRLGNLGLTYYALGQVERAIGFHEQALVIAKEIGDRRGEGNRLGNLGLAYRNLGQVERAIGFYEQALVISKEIGDRRGGGARLGNLGNAYYALGQVERAIGFYEQALVISKEIGDRRGEGTWLGNLGGAYAGLGQVERAIGYYQQALAISKEIGDRNGEGIDLNNLGDAYSALGQAEKAQQYWQESLHIFEEIKSPHADAVRQSLSSLQN